MNNRKFYSCERNNYYYGKLLTSRDFQIEQSYMNDKRRMSNRLFHGSGIVMGLKVMEADDTAIILQSGCAIDGGGREIVVPETEVVKLSTIDGSRELRTDVAYLSISYEEKKEDKVYAVMGNVSAEDEKSETGEYNHIRENYRLHLQDAADCAPVAEPKDKYLKKQVLFEDEDYLIMQEVAAYLPSDCNLASRLIVYKKRYTQDLLTVSYTLDVEGLKEQSIPVKVENLNLDRYETYSCMQSIIPQEEIRYLSDFELKVRNLEVIKSKQKCQTSPVPPVTVVISDTKLRSLIVEDSYKTAMDADIEESYDNKIYLARLYLIRSGGRILLERIEDVPFRQYIYSAAQLMLIEELREYYPLLEENGPELRVVRREVETGSTQTTAEKKKEFVTGVFDLSLGNARESGRVFYSEEIMHGLGEGPVYVEAAYEILNKENEKIREEILLGDASLFASNETEEEQLQISCGVKILPERGTFIVAVKPRNRVYRSSIRVRWYACRTEDTDKNISRMKSKQGMIILSPDTITTTPKGIVQIQPQFVNMPAEACSYEVLDLAGGRIDNNGIYTAPTAEGVYEVKVSCISSPEIFAHAYIIVSSEK
ncbi:MAG: hypothetical protein ACI4D5_06340 [Kineothrix sp.]